MITVDDSTGALLLSLDDLVDAGDGGRASAQIESSHLRLESHARERFATAELGAGARVELEVALELDWHARVVTIRGRVACVRSGKRGASVLELAFAPSDDPDTDLRRARERAAFGALLLALGGEKIARFGVVHAPLVEGASAERTERFAPAAIATLLDERLARLERIWLGERREARPSPPFPFAEPRPAQLELLRAVADAAEAGLILLASAPTGSGKTAAVLHPLLVRAVRERSRVTFTTSRVSQQALALETLARMLPPGGPAYAVQISAQQRICPYAALRCGLRPCPWRRRFAERLAVSGIALELAARGVVDSQAISDAASAHELCPFETSLALADDAVALVADVNYVFDPHVYLRRVLDATPAREYLVVDEAHDLLERVRESLSAELEPARLLALAERERERGRVRAGAAALLAELAEACEREVARLAEERADDAPWVEPLPRGFFEPFALRAAEADVALGSQAARAPIASDGADARGRDPLRTALRSVGVLARAAEGDPERIAALWSPAQLRVLCLDPAPWIGARLRAFRSAALVSATLTPLDFHAQTLGVAGPRCVSLELDSPFPRANRVILLVDSVDTRLRERSANAAPIAAAIARAVASRPGNWLAFFPSFAFRDEVIAAIPRNHLRVLLQLPGVPVEALLRKLREPRAGATLLAGVHGGSLAEGVDYPGALAIGVFVVGPGLPRADRERELVRAYYEREHGDGFDLAYVFPGLARSAQAGGRVLRGPDDVGAIVLFDRRFAEPRYRARLPRWWREELVVVSDPEPALREFWARIDTRVPSLPSSET